MTRTAADLFDHYADEPTTKRSNRFDRTERTVDGERVVVVKTYTVDWVFHAPHTADCRHAFFVTYDPRGYGGERTEYKTVIAPESMQNASWCSTSVQVLGHSRPVTVEHPTGEDIRKVIAEVRADVAAYEAEVARLRPHAAYTKTAPGEPLAAEDAEVGQVAWVHAKGQWRRGLVSAIGRSRVTVAYFVESTGSITSKSGTAKVPVRA